MLDLKIENISFQTHLKLEIKVTNQWSLSSDAHIFPNPIFNALFFHVNMWVMMLLSPPPNMNTLQLTLHKPPTDIPRYPWKVSKVVQEASLHRGRADGRSRGGERRAPLASGRAELPGRPNWEAECRGRNCRWGRVGRHWKVVFFGLKPRWKGWPCFHLNWPVTSEPGLVQKRQK